MKNESEIYPCANRVLIRPDEIEKKTEGGIIIPQNVSELHQMAQSIGTLVAVGPDAFTHSFEIDAEGRVLSRRAYSQPFAKVGERVAFAKYGGLQVQGADGVAYRILNDIDITAVVGEGVSFTDIQSRKAVHEQRR